MVQLLSDMERAARRDALLGGFDQRAPQRRRALAACFGDEKAAGVSESARRRFEALIDEIAYVGRERDPLGQALIACYEVLPYGLELRERGHPLEEIGTFIYDAFEVPTAPQTRSSWPQSLLAPLQRRRQQARMRKRARVSQARAHPNEFIFEVVDVRGSEFDRGFNITQCAICTAFSKHDALEMVPYLCAVDDKMSDAQSDGLRRTGTRALGAHHCDFRFKQGGEPLRLVDQYDLATRQRKS